MGSDQLEVFGNEFRYGVERCFNICSGEEVGRNECAYDEVGEFACLQASRPYDGGALQDVPKCFLECSSHCRQLLGEITEQEEWLMLDHPAGGVVRQKAE